MFYKTHTHKMGIKKIPLSEGEIKIKIVGKVALGCKAIYIIFT